MKLNNIFKHFHKICIHKFWVFYYCCKVRIPWRGLVHDLSKFSPTEFKESIKYYNGKKSPIDIARKENGCSYAWIHHKALNKHHYQYWIDKYSISNKHPSYGIMPYKYATEMFCDYLAAARTYMGKDFNIDSEIEWWNERCKMTYVPPYIQNFINLSFAFIKIDNSINMHDLYMSYRLATNTLNPIVEHSFYEILGVKKVPNDEI